MTKPKYDTSDSKSSTDEPLFDDSNGTDDTNDTNLEECPTTLSKPA